ncbi:radical SAM protein [Clostridiaceae bacterium UIB06]|uniref:Radical SAM protein n=1 Tax=Clostridium thailandense TaxID=2794346 RepID=A0A949TVY2_9CLOT|nr:radical SAM protein [Clostridium thailandense]MBV7271963.1 radical SAM protein [Clostridium thailandense]MCH5137189.1 radical SAM protein [Clostridiaceae bacterium UIB06]
MSKSHYIIPIFVPHEGCPHNCVFCNQETITGNIQKVDGEFTRNLINKYLETIKKENSIIEVSFFGGTFTAISLEKQQELLSVAKEYKDKGIINFIHLSTRPDYIDDKILINLKNYSVDVIELGIQSLDEEVLIKSGRGHSEGDVARASKLIKEYGFILGHQVMLGLPEDNFQRDIETVQKSIAMKPDIYRIYPALVIKNTPMEKMFNNGTYKPYELYEAVKIAKVIYSMAIANNINVIRVGLQPTEEINEGRELVAGPFHPAFRELVEGSIYNDMILEEIFDINKELVIRINEKDLSKLYANKKKFFNDIKKQLKTQNIYVIQDNSLDRGSLILKQEENYKKMSINEYMMKKYKEGNLSSL